MKFFFVSILLFAFTCSSPKESKLDIYRCGTEYSFSDVSFTRNSNLIGNIQFIYFVDSVSEVPRYYFDSILSNLNSYTTQANIVFNIKKITSVKILGAKNNYLNYPSFAIDYNLEDCLNIYIFDKHQPNMVGEKKNIKAEAAGVPSRTIAIIDPYLLSSTLPHEVFHCLGLHHVHQPDVDEGYSTVTGDMVCDTRYIGNLDELIDESCNYIGPELPLPDNGNNYTCNIMSYIYANCRNCLTEGQINRIKAVIHSSGDLKKIFGFNVENL